jgi:hypothetical protein
LLFSLLLLLLFCVVWLDLFGFSMINFAICQISYVHSRSIAFLLVLMVLLLTTLLPLPIIHGYASCDPVFPDSIPTELSLITSLQTLLIWGNPQRLIQQQVISQGSAAVLKCIREKHDQKIGTTYIMLCFHSFCILCVVFLLTFAFFVNHDDHTCFIFA